eukprot:920361-Heterocapsa_arctica.AAC.1
MAVLEFASIRTDTNPRGKGRAKGDRDDVAGNGIAGNGADPLDPWTTQMSKTVMKLTSHLRAALVQDKIITYYTE